MDRILITGGAPLSGEVEISGSKNASLPLMAAALLARGPSHIERIPRLADIENMSRMIEHLGARVRRSNSGLDIDPSGFRDTPASYDLMRRMRASIYVMGPMLARFGHAQVSLPGGCAIGTRPVDLHLRGMEALGADIKISHGYIKAQAPKNGLLGAEISLQGEEGPSVGATCNILMAATLARGRSVLRHCAREPHVNDLARFLNKMGASVDGIGTDTLTVHGVERLEGVDYRVIPDQIEAGTFMIAPALAGGQIVMRHCHPSHMQTEIEMFRQMGGQVEALSDGHSLRVSHSGDVPRPAHITTAPFPGFPTDLQAQFTVLMTLAQGKSSVTDVIFPDRFIHAAELNRMGARIAVHNGKATIQGVEALSGATVMASDLRASAALVLAGLAAQGETEILRVYHIDRGYERIEKKFQALGANIRRVSASPS